ncbi:tetratricopeptide repeat protein [Fulvivirga sediminis]|uniref:Tetratricopeptide repeat protein n=1 Tax=Fulvivirga sediminis TaxID=2803949 RepID=A0A937F609_9BACT|nr:tetratricopeptide repeat protein [Fulvivirga sediminis]MBL3655666.1 tetratricopeptide repeat protein [Fulvivirga sediminis]
MNSPRINQLLKFLKEDPNDPFTLYALATEYRNSDTQKALEYYDILLSQHPDYLPTYYHAANLLIELNEQDRAESIFVKGIELAKSQNNSLLLRELQNAYNNFLFED